MSEYKGIYVECNEGWRGLYEPLIDLCILYNIKVLQVKEKFGGLRFYTASPLGTPDLELLIQAAEAQSYHTCEECGEHGISGWDDKNHKPIYKVTTTGGWIKSLCVSCRTKGEEDRKLVSWKKKEAEGGEHVSN